MALVGKKKPDNADALVSALEEIRDKDTHPVVKGGDFDVVFGLYADIADQALRGYYGNQTGTAS